MKNKNIQFLLIGFALIITMLAYGLKVNQKFYLEDSYYGNTTLEEINLEKLNQLTEEKQSFGVFVYQPSCSNSESFEKVLKEFQSENQIKFYKITFSSILESELKETIKFYPSFILYNKGKQIDFLKADSDKHKEYYQSKEGFASWFNKYVLSKEKNTTTDNKNNVEEKYLDPIALETIKKENGKINVYLFWGNGCPHCADELSFFENLEEEYKNKINLITFQVFQNEENTKLLNQFAEAMNETVTGVPYTIIGKKSFKGYGAGLGDTLKKTIDEEIKQNYDVYLDTIKNK